MKQVARIKFAIILFICAEIIGSSMCFAVSIDFRGGTWEMHLVNGQAIDGITHIETEELDTGETVVTYKREDGSEGFKSLPELTKKTKVEIIQFAEDGDDADKKKSKYLELADEVDRLGAEIKRREAALKQELSEMKAGGSQGIPYYSIDKYCKGISSFSGGSYMIEMGCRKNEEEAKSRLRRMYIPGRIKKYCSEIGATGGGSYMLYLGCVRNEIDARNSLR